MAPPSSDLRGEFRRRIVLGLGGTTGGVPMASMPSHDPGRPAVDEGQDPDPALVGTNPAN
jgi:hypothetical protein